MLKARQMEIAGSAFACPAQVMLHNLPHVLIRAETQGLFHYPDQVALCICGRLASNLEEWSDLYAQDRTRGRLATG